MEIGARLEMERIDKAENVRRFYAMEVAEDRQLSLFVGSPSTGAPQARLLILAWGRLGTRLQVKRERYEDPVRLGARWRALEKKRARHQYVVTLRRDGTSNAPSTNGTRTETGTAGRSAPTT